MLVNGVGGMGLRVNGVEQSVAASSLTVSSALTYPARACKATRSTNQSIPNNADTTLLWDQEEFDTDGFHDNVTNTNRFTAPVAGKYLVTCAIQIAHAATGSRYFKFQKNGTDYGSIVAFSASAGADPDFFTISDIVNLAAGDVMSGVVYQDSGGALNVIAAGGYTHFSIAYIGA